MNYIKYKAGYKYQLQEIHIDQTDVKPDQYIHIDFISLSTQGIITIQQWYAWDGPSGPTIDTPEFMRGSLIHDALYQLMRGNYLDHKKYRKAADKTLRRICIEDKMSFFRAWYVYYGVRKFADFASEPSDRKKAIFAPSNFEAI